MFIGRFIALLRSWAAALAGVAEMPYGTFTFWNASGGIAWASVFGTLGYVFGHNLPLLEHYLGRFSIALGVVAAVAVVTFLVIRQRREAREAEPDPGAGR